MKLGQMPNQAETGPELAMKRIRIVANNVQSTAHSRSLRAECGYDDVATRLNGVRDLTHVGRPVALTPLESGRPHGHATRRTDGAKSETS